MAKHSPHSQMFSSFGCAQINCHQTTKMMVDNFSGWGSKCVGCPLRLWYANDIGWVVHCQSGACARRTCQQSGMEWNQIEKKPITPIILILEAWNGITWCEKVAHVCTTCRAIYCCCTTAFQCSVYIVHKYHYIYWHRLTLGQPLLHLLQLAHWTNWLNATNAVTD